MRERCTELDGDRCRCLRAPHRTGPHDFSYTPAATLATSAPAAARALVVVDGAGRPLPNRGAIPRCASTSAGQLCCYADRHAGDHCNPTGTRTW